MSEPALLALVVVLVASGALIAIAIVRGRFLAKASEIEEIDQRFQSTFEQAAVGMAHLGRDSRWIRINARFCELTGYSHDELMNMSVDDIVHPLDRERDAAARRALFAGEVDKTVIEKRYVQKEGQVIWVNATRAAIRDATGHPIFFATVVEEITGRREAEAKLSAGEAQYRAIFDSAVEAMAVIDSRGTIQSINPSVERTFGYESDELVGQNIKMLMPGDIADHHDGYLSRYGRTGKKAIIGIGREVIGQRKDGSRFPLDLSVAEWERGGEPFFTGVMRDISARKNAETALIAGEAQYRAIFDSAVEAMAVIDEEGTIQSINPSVERTFGYQSDELVGRNIKMLMPGDIAEHHDGYLGRYSRTGKKAIIGIGREVIGQRKDGSRFPLDLSVAEWERGGATFFTGVMRDISARKDAEAALIAGEAQYRAIFDSAVEAMAVIDAKGIIQSINPSVERTFGYNQAELIGSNIKMLMPRAIATHHDGYLGAYRDTGKKAIIGIGREVIGQRKDGSQFPLDLSVAEWERGGATFFTGVMRDVSARKDAESALRKSEESLRGLQNEFAHLARVNDLGEMAAAIAHEINQPLTAIVNFLNTGLFMAGEGTLVSDAEETEQLMRQAFEQALRAGEIVRRLREFIGQGTGVRRPESVERLIDSAIALALIDARSNGIEVHRIVEAADAEVEVDAVQIQQVLANLMRNGVDAMLGARRTGVTPALTVTASLGPHRMVEIAITDNGPGISSDIADRLFDPFVTTKSNGMGMGLSVCRRLIEAHGGTIDAQSMPGQGACFSFRLPLFRPVLH